MSDLNNKHLPSDIDSLTRKDLVQIYHIHAEEFQKLQAENEKLKAQNIRLAVNVESCAELIHMDMGQAIERLFEIDNTEESELVAQRDLEQQAKGVEDFIKSIDPYISRGESWILRFDDVISDEYLEKLRQQASELNK